MDHHHNYHRLLAMFVLHLVAMYALMYAMVDTVADIYPSHNQLYMAALMAAPMLILELLIMGSMYPKKKLNLGIIAAGLVVLVCSFVLIRGQIGIGDQQFLRSMIPHHSGAILMCEKSSLHNAEIQKLCQDIVVGQQKEIDQMKALLNQL